MLSVNILQVKKINLKRIDKLATDSSNIRIDKNYDKYIFNYTDLPLPEEAKRVLCVDQKFGLTVKKTDIHPVILIKDTEFLVNNLPSLAEEEDLVENERNTLRSKIVNIINNFYKKPEQKRLDQFNRDVQKTNKFLKQNKDIIVTKSDKGNSTIIMTREEYVQVMTSMLQDTTTYKKIHKDPTSKFQKMANEMATMLSLNSIIDEDSLKRFKIYNAVTPRLYGLTKTHKIGCVLRPVVSCIGAPSYNLAKLLHKILLPVIKTFSFRIKNSFEFVELIKPIVLPADYVLISLDVVSLFTNIPKALVLQIIDEEWNNWSRLMRLKDKELLLKLVNFCFDSSYFSFNGQLYQQCDGTSMGNPASPDLADIVMNYIFRSVINHSSCQWEESINVD
ncbi:uncharacterized protein LOC130676318 [Microplitis mediator]|uniref:uncharacterized protein LOC130676318 n=1 Tax=Microplitis mediator TaxID=375433 RepID=UPI0025537D93|nr:uncharacterized protein LOC130676318 [Microplitis mediator]